jgi:YjbE family integral membrane protein
VLAALFRVVTIDLVLAGDNAIVIGLAAAGLPAAQRRKAILIGIAAATVLRIIFAVTAVQLLNVRGLVLVGGLLLLWVCWKMGRDLWSPDEAVAVETAAGADAAGEVAHHHKTLRQAALQIVIADVSMSLDNVLAVAGASRTEPWALVFGLVLSIGLMAAAAALIARLLTRFRWIAWLGLGVIFYVALMMVYDGLLEVVP